MWQFDTRSDMTLQWQGHIGIVNWCIST